MDWAKGKTVLIIIFLALNVFLVVNNITVRMESGVSGETRKNIEKILADKNISWLGKIPSESRYGAVISYDVADATLDRAVIIAKLLGETGKGVTEAKQDEVLLKDSKRLSFKKEGTFVFEDSNPIGDIDITNEKAVENYILNFIGSLQLPVDLKQYSRKMVRDADGNISATFIEKKSNFLFFDNYLKIDISKKGIKYLELSYRKVKEGSFSKKSVKVMPAHQVLLKNMNNLSGMVIREIELGFSSSAPEQDIKGSWEELVWRIEYDNNRAEYFNAYTGNKLLSIK